MANFKVGDKVIAKVNIQDIIIKGKDYIVDGFTCCPSCGVQCVYIKGLALTVASICPADDGGCGYRDVYVRINFFSSVFEKPISLSDCVEYRLKVSIPELVEIKELQNQ